MRNCFLIVLSALAFVRCTNTSTDFGERTGRISGRAVKGPIAGGEIVVTSALAGDEIARGTTDDNGAFTVAMGTVPGDYRVCVTGGGFMEEATGTRVELETNELCAPLEAFGIAEEREIVITPWTHLALARAEALLRLRGVPFAEASVQARAEIDAFLTCSNPGLTLIGADPLDATSDSVSGLELTPSLLSGLLLGGLSQQAKMVSKKLSVTPGVSITSLSLTRAFAEDLWADGGFDGIGLDGPLHLEGHVLGPDSIRGAQEGFAQAVRSFLLSPRNQTSITPQDLQALLACIAAAYGPLFPSGPGGTLDVDGPALTFMTPTPGSSVAGVVSVRVEAADVSEIEDIWIEDGPGLSAQMPVLDGHAANVTASIDTTQLSDGIQIIRAFSLDVLGNESEGTIEIDVNNGAPFITVLEPSSGTVSGADVAIRVTAADPQGVAALGIIRPMLEDTNPATDVFEAIWDTTVLVDGTAVLEFSAADNEGNPTTASVAVTVDNLKPGSISVQAFMDTPVEDIAIEVLALDANGARGDILATNQGTAFGSSWSGEMPDTYAGPVLVRGCGTQAHYSNAATEQPVVFGAGDELLLLAEYAPSAAGTHLTDLSLNALTTLAAHAALARWRDGMEAGAAIALGNQLVAEHLQRPEPFDLITTPASDFTQDPVADAFAAQKVGVVHAGLSQLGAEWAADAALPATALPSLAVLGKLVEDLEDGVLDGVDSSEAPVQVTNSRVLATNTFRSELALAVVTWLESSANQSSLEPGNFTQGGGTLELMASNTSELFGSEPPESFDIFGPTVTFVQPTEGQALSGVVDVIATASDPSSVTLMLGYVDYQVSAALAADRDGSLDGFLAALDTTALTDGSHMLRIVATDSRDNLSINDLPVVVDNSPPTVTLLGPALTGSATVTVTGSVDDTQSGVVTLEIWVNSDAPEITNDPSGAFTRLVDLPCNAYSEVSARATNRAGVSSTTAITVGCDDRPPGFALLTSTYIPTSRMDVTYDAGSETLLYNLQFDQQPVSLHQLNWSSPGPTIEKFFSRLDHIPSRGVTRASNNLPYLAIAPDDFAQDGTEVGAALETMEVSYRYSFQGVVKRDWTDLSLSSVDGAFVLPFSYQDLGSDLADPTGTEEHRIDVRMADPQGNVVVEEVYFRMQTTSPPIAYADCGLGYLQDRTLANDRLHEWFSFDHPSYFSGKLVFPRLPESTLAPWTYGLRIPSPAVTFTETQRAQYKTVSRYAPCADYIGDWCSTANDAAGADSTCWVQVNDREMHRYTVGAAATGSICSDSFWPIGPATSVPVALSSGTFPGGVDGVPTSWTYDSVAETWEVPTADYLASPWYQPLLFRLRTTPARPVLSTPDLEGSMWRGTTKHGGGWGYLIRSHTGYELIRKWSPGAGIDYHWSRVFQADEYIQSLEVTVPAVVPEVTIVGLGAVSVLAFDADCGVDVVTNQTE